MVTFLPPSMPTSTRKTSVTVTPVKNHELPSRVRMEQEMIIMRETDQWMAEHYKSRA